MILYSPYKFYYIRVTHATSCRISRCLLAAPLVSWCIVRAGPMPAGVELGTMPFVSSKGKPAQSPKARPSRDRAARVCGPVRSPRESEGCTTFESVLIGNFGTSAGVLAFSDTPNPGVPIRLRCASASSLISCRERSASTWPHGLPVSATFFSCRGLCAPCIPRTNNDTRGWNSPAFLRACGHGGSVVDNLLQV